MYTNWIALLAGFALACAPSPQTPEVGWTGADLSVAPPPGFALHADTMAPGTTAAITVVDALPGETVFLLASNSAGPGPCLPNGSCLDLDGMLRISRRGRQRARADPPPSPPINAGRNGGPPPSRGLRQRSERDVRGALGHHHG